MVTKQDKINGWDNIRIKISTKKKLMQLKLNLDLLTFDEVIVNIMNKLK